MLSIKRLSLEDALVLVDGAEKRSAQMGVSQCIAIADESGNLIAFKRMNGGKVTSISIAINKAFTAAAARNPTAFYNDACQPGKPTFGIHVTNDGKFCIIGGGLPVRIEGEIVGGIGVSSGTAEQDIICAQAGIDHFTAIRAKATAKKRSVVKDIAPAPRRPVGAARRAGTRPGVGR